MKIRTTEEICKNIADEFGLNTGKVQYPNLGLYSTLGIPQNEKGKTIYLAARPGIGKTNLALDIALSAALSSNKEVLYFTAYSTAEKLFKTLLQKLSGININEAKAENIDKQEISKWLEKLKNLNITVFNYSDAIIQTIEEMLINKRNPSLIIIDDYDFLLRFEKNASIKIKALSHCYNTSILLCGFTNKEKPLLEDFYKKGRLFDVVTVLHREAYYDTNDDDFDPSFAELIVLKNVFGEIGKTNLRFDFKSYSFKEIL